MTIRLHFRALLATLAMVTSIGVLATPARIKPTRLADAPASAASVTAPTSPDAVAWPWQRTSTLTDLGRTSDALLTGVRNAATIEFQVRSDRLVRAAELDLTYTPSPALLPVLSHLRVYLNDTLMDVVPIGKDQLGRKNSVKLPLDARLLQGFNRVRIEFVGHYTDTCEDPTNSALWVDIDQASTLHLSGQPLAMRNDLSAFPLPFFDPHDARRLVLPVMFAGAPSTAQQQAAAVLASYFGSLAGWWRQASFPVSFGVLPAAGNAVVFGVNGHFPAVIAQHAPVDGPQIELAAVPGTTDRKLLLVLGRNDADLQQAVMAMAEGNVLFRGAVVKVDGVKALAPRQPYDAPNWVRTNRPVRFGDLLDYPQQLRSSGMNAGPLTLNLNIPPDLFIWRNQGIPLNLRYRYTTPVHDDGSSLSVSINNQFVASFPLRQRSGKQGLGEVRLPVLGSEAGSGNGKLLIPALKLGERNTLSFDFRYTSLPAGAQKDYCQTVLPPDLHAAVDDDSTIDFSGFYHYIGMPDLSAFALSGFPFTRMADLSQTVALVPRQATPSQVTLLLDTVGGLGAQSGYPGYGLRVSDDAAAVMKLDADLLVFGSLPPKAAADMQPALLIEQQRTTLVNGMEPSPQTAVADARRGIDRNDAPVTRVSVSAQAPFAAIVGLQSPSHAQRSVVALLATTPADDALLSNALTDTGKRDAIAGAVAIVRDSGIHSQFAGAHYYVGRLPWWWLLWYRLSGHPAWLALLAVLAVLLAAFVVWRLLRMQAARRLSNGG